MVCYGGGRTGRKLARIFRKQPSHSSSSESTEIRISLQGQCSILSRSQVRDWYISTSSLCKFVAVAVTQANFSWGHNMKLVKVIVTFTLELIFFLHRATQKTFASVLFALLRASWPSYFGKKCSVKIITVSCSFLLLSSFCFLKKCSMQWLYFYPLLFNFWPPAPNNFFRINKALFSDQCLGWFHDKSLRYYY